MKIMKSVVALAMVVSVFGAGVSAWAEDSAGLYGKSPADWPNGTVSILMPTSDGGGTEAFLRLMHENMQKKYPDKIKAFTYTATGAGNGAVVYEMARTAKPDGQTLMIIHMIPFIKYYTGMYDHNPIENYTIVAAMPVENPYVMVVRADSPHNSADDVAKFIRENPNEMVCGLELGGNAQMAASLFAQDAGGKFKYVEAGSTAHKLAALQGGHIDITMSQIHGAKQYVDNGDLKVLGVYTSDGSRSNLAPDWPSFVELGYPNCKWNMPQIVYAPKGLDDDVRQTIFNYFKEAASAPELQEHFTKINQPLSCLDSPDESLQFVKDFAAKIHGSIVDLGMLKEGR